MRHYLTSLPGGFWTQFLVVMLVIFLLGFFLDFIEIAVVVVPIVAPILLMNPEANVTAVWLGVMIGLNIQTSFLTPPFGFALFYLRGVADKVVKTLDIYKGAAVFIVLQLMGLAIAGYFPEVWSITCRTAPICCRKRHHHRSTPNCRSAWRIMCGLSWRITVMRFGRLSTRRMGWI
ncbi:MAG: TRAP transporter large permease subunit [Thiolinea sp.]